MDEHIEKLTEGIVATPLFKETDKAEKNLLGLMREKGVYIAYRNDPVCATLIDDVKRRAKRILGIEIIDFNDIGDRSPGRPFATSIEKFLSEDALGLIALFTPEDLYEIWAEVIEPLLENQDKGIYKVLDRYVNMDDKNKECGRIKKAKPCLNVCYEAGIASGRKIPLFLINVSCSVPTDIENLVRINLSVKKQKRSKSLRITSKKMLSKLEKQLEYWKPEIDNKISLLKI